MERVGIFLMGVAAAGLFPAQSEARPYPAENQVPVALVNVDRQPNYTEVRLQVQSSISRVCWNMSGPNSPYLVGGGNRYRMLGGGNITACPARRDYAPGDMMVLRFEPLGSGVRQFSLVEGAGGEAQMNNASSSDARYWNFLRIEVPARCGLFDGPKPNGPMSYFDVTNNCSAVQDCWILVNGKPPRYQKRLPPGGVERFDVGVLTEGYALETDCTPVS